MPIEKLSKDGFCFLWTLAGNLISGQECLNHWGYSLIDELIWLKTIKGKKAFVSHGYYFLHSTERCLVGIKGRPEYRSKISNDIIIADIRKKSQKPEQLYHVIEQLMPGGKRLEVFARNNNLRKGWFSIGNQIGEQFDDFENTIDCNECDCSIRIGTKRYKSRLKANFDLCDKCFIQYLNNMRVRREDFFELNNEVDDPVIHEETECNTCRQNPIWGTLFHCDTCKDVDYCENCLDQLLASAGTCKDHPLSHHELPERGYGQAVHYDRRCAKCLTRPIIGCCIVCTECNIDLCQNCFFNLSDNDLHQYLSMHKLNHKVELLSKPCRAKPMCTCNGCNSKQESEHMRCQQCYKFCLCNGCFEQKDSMDFANVLAHKRYHYFEEC